MPRPQYPTPRAVTPQAPSSAPTYTRPTTRPTSPTYTRPTPAAPDYTPVTPRARGTERQLPSPRTTTRQDGSRYDGNARPIGGTITRPTTRIDTDTVTRRTPTSMRRGEAGRDRTIQRPSLTDSRYTSRPDTARQPSITRPSANGTERRPQPGSARISERTNGGATPRDSLRAGATARTRPSTSSSASITSPAPRLVPRSDAPRLGTRRSGTSLVAGVTGVARSSPSWSSRRSYASCSPVLWNSWWDPCRYGSYWNTSWSSYGGFGAFAVSSWLWNPWSYCRSYYWDNCYSYSWYQRWSRPYCASASYWWYPSTTYCPIYLQVPSSVVVVDNPAPAGERVAAPAGDVVVRSPALPADVGARGLPADDLAAKYVELGRFYFQANRFAEAADAYARARTYSPDDGALHFELADAAFATGDYYYAAFLIAEALRLDPTLANADADKRDYYGDEKLFDLHMETLERYLESRPYDAQAHLVHGYNLRFSAQPEAAAAAFRRVLEITPENRAAQTFLAALASTPAEPEIR